MEKQVLLDKMNIRLDKIRPYLKVDGGNVELLDFVDGYAIVKLLGNCSSCSMSKMTLKIGIEKELKSHFPELIGVKEISTIDEQN